MRDAIAMWRSTKMVVLVALTAAVYAAVLIPFKPIPIIPGITEIRPAAAIPIVCGLLFGPAAAWGSAIGNLMGDFFGTVGPGSLFGLVGNFLLAYVPYRLWHLFQPRRLANGSIRQVVPFVLVTIAGSASCAIVVGFGVDLLGIAPYEIVTTIIAVNNTLVGIVLGMPLLALLSPRAHRWGLTYRQTMSSADLRSGILAYPASLVILAGGAIGTLAALDKMGVIASLGALLSAVIRLEPIRPAVAAASGQALWIPAQMSLRELGLYCCLMLLGGVFLLARLPTRPRATREEGEADFDATAAAVAVQGLSFAYSGTADWALAGIAFEQKRGELRFLMGRTGSGKSTLCLCLSGIIPHLQRGDYAGRVLICGAEVAGIPVAELAQHVGIVFQDFDSQLFCSDVRHEIAFALENQGMPPSQMHEQVEKWLAALDLTALADRDPVTLSGGEKQRLALAAVMAAEPDIVVLDEPTTDLDPIGRSEFVQAWHRLKDEGRTLLIAGHSSAEALQADCLMVLADGQVACEGSPHGPLTDPDMAAGLDVQCLPATQICAALGLADRPTTPVEAVDCLRRSEVVLDHDAWQQLQGGDAARAARWGEPLVEVREVSFSYDDAPALQDVSLQVRRGEFVLILGSNGAGKTTLCRHFNGLLTPDTGQVIVGGEPAADRDVADLAGTVGYLFQNPDHQIFAQTVYEEVAFGVGNLGLCAAEIEERVAGALRLTELADYRHMDPFALTKGERQRVALASILAMAPELVVFDEPTTGLDVPQQRAMFRLLRRLSDEGHTIVVVTHHTELALPHADRAVLMADGRIIADGPVRQVFSQPQLCAAAHQEIPAAVQVSQELFGVALLSAGEFARCVRVPSGSGGGER